MVIKHVYHLAFRSPETSVADMFMDHIDRARPEIKSAKKLGRVRYEPDENHDNKDLAVCSYSDFSKKS
jgi:hypothetical protein